MRAKKRYLDEELAKINGSYNKGNIKKEHFITLLKLKNAIRLEKQLANDTLDIVNKLGSNVGDLVSEILEIE